MAWTWKRSKKNSSPRRWTSSHGNQIRAASYLNLSRKTLLHRLAKFGIVGRAALEQGRADSEAVGKSA